MDTGHRATLVEELLGNAGWIQTLARSLVRDAATADDLVQETWLLALRRPASEGPPPRRWLSKVLTRLAGQRARSEAGRRLREQRDTGAAESESPDELALAAERHRLLAEAVTRLPEPLRSTLVLRYLRGCEPAEIARLQGLPAGTVRWRLKRAREELRLDLDRRLGGGPGTWLAALAPLIRVPRRAAARSTLLGGTLIVKKFVAVSLAVALFAGLWVAGRWAPSRPEAVRPTSVTSPMDLPRPDRAISEMPSRVELRSGAPKADGPSRAVAGDEQAGAPAAGWWLVGTVRAAGGPRPRLRVTSEGGPGPLEGRVGPDGRVELNLAPLFDDSAHLPAMLHVDVDQSSCIAQRVSFRVGRRDRQAGYIEGERALFVLDVDLQPAASLVAGEVTWPEGVAAERVRVALFAAEADGGPAYEPLASAGVDAGGHFLLCAPEVGLQRIVAFVDQARDPDVLLARPAWREVDVLPGEFGLQEPLALTVGEILAGTFVAGGLTPGLAFELRFTAVDFDLIRSFRRLFWNGTSFEYGTLLTVTDEYGRFRLQGPAPGQYEVSLGGLRQDGQPVKLSYGSASSVRSRVRAPDATCRLVDHGLLLWQVLSAGAPLPLVKFKILGNDGADSTRGQSDTRGRVALIHPRNSEDDSILFQAPGHSSVTVPLQQGTSAHGLWSVIELERKEARAHLVLDLQGDERRTVERFQVSLRRTDIPSPPSGLNERHILKRTSGSIFIGNLDPRNYDIRLTPARAEGTGFWYSIDTFVLPASLQVELTAGDEARAVVVLSEGGRLQVSNPRGWAPESWGSGGVRFRLLDTDGAEVAAHSITAQAMSTFLQWDKDNHIDPALRPGSYTLLVWPRSGAENAVRTMPFTIEAGETTILPSR